MVKEERGWRGALGQLIWRNWLTLFGSSLTTVSAGAIIVFLALEFSGVPLSPYIGILSYLLLPAVFILGLLFIPLGAYLDRRHRRRNNITETPHIKLDFNSPRMQKLAVIVGFLTLFNLIIVSIASYEGAVYMESVAFCGQTCHTVMEPEFMAHMDSPHAMVKCVDCHIGPGIPALVHAKLNGLNQVYGVLTGSYERPIPAPVHNLADANLTCGECHNGNKDLGDILKVTTDYGLDDENTPLTSVLLMHVGGDGDGIHGWHLDPDREITYYAPDDDRSVVSYVNVKNPDGTTVEYFADGAEISPATLKPDALRRMDCTDCHNRATHQFSMPGPALNAALDDGRLDVGLPAIKQAGLDALEHAVDSEDGLRLISDEITAFYTENHSEVVAEKAASVDAAIATIQAIYRRNIFPKMSIGWGTYPDHNGHTQFDGCFRCHDDGHSSRDGEHVISQDCTMCHNVVAWQEENPDILATLGVQ